MVPQVFHYIHNIIHKHFHCQFPSDKDFDDRWNIFLTLRIGAYKDPEWVPAGQLRADKECHGKLSFRLEKDH